MKKLLSLAGLVLLVVAGLGQSAIQRTMLTTNTVPAGVNGQVLVLVSGVPRWSTNAGSLSLSNVTVFGTLTVSTQLVINGTGPGTIQLYATNGTSIVTISSPDSFTSYTLYLPTGIQTNAVLQSTADGHLYWSTDPVLNSVEVTGSGAGYLLIGDASTTNTFKLVGPAAFGSSFTNLWPASPGTNGQVLTMGTNGQWYFGTPGSSGGDIIWTNDVTIHPIDLSFGVRFSAPYGGISIGSNTPAASGGTVLYYLGNVDVGDPGAPQVVVENTDSSGADVYMQDLVPIDAPSGEYHAKLIRSATDGTNLWDFTVDVGTVGGSPRGFVELTGQSATGDSGSFRADVLANSSSPALLIDTALAHTSGNLAEYRNRGTNVFGVPRDNAVGDLFNDGTGTLAWVNRRVEPLTALTWGATTTISLAASETNYRTLTLGGDTVVATSNRAAGHWVTVLVTGAATNCAVSFPSWRFMNSAAPTTLAAGKVASLTVFFTDGTDAAAVANYAVEP